jgi:hypothetical protein
MSQTIRPTTVLLGGVAGVERWPEGPTDEAGPLIRSAPVGQSTEGGAR